MNLNPIRDDAYLTKVLDELAFCCKSTTTPLGLAFRDVLRKFLIDQGLDKNPDAFADLPDAEYAFVELFGHTCLGACIVREVRKFGVVFCEASPLDESGKPGRAQLIQGSSIYRLRSITKDEALSVAKRRLMYLPAPSESQRDREGDERRDDEDDPIDAHYADGESGSSSGSVSFFLSDCCEQGEQKEITASALHIAYAEYCEEDGLEALGPRAFHLEIVKIAGYVNRTGQRIYTGLQLSENAMHDYRGQLSLQTTDELIEELRTDLVAAKEAGEDNLASDLEMRLHVLLKKQAAAGGEPSDPPISDDDVRAQAQAQKHLPDMNPARNPAPDLENL